MNEEFINLFIYEAFSSIKHNTQIIYAIMIDFVLCLYMMLELSVLNSYSTKKWIKHEYK